MNMSIGISGLSGGEFRGQRITDVKVDWERFIEPERPVEDVLIDLSARPVSPDSHPSRQPDRPLR